MHLSSMLIYSTIFRSVSALDPWYFTGTDPSNHFHPESGSTPSACIRLDDPIGNIWTGKLVIVGASISWGIRIEYYRHTLSASSTVLYRSLKISQMSCLITAFIHDSFSHY
jgi:hypothetical protein